MVESPTQPPSAPTSDSSLPPHPLMPRYYRDADEKRAFLKTIFDDTAADYDKVERWLSMGSGKWYRRQALLRAGLKQGMKVADVAVGTGLVAREALAIIGTTGKIVGIDPSPEMMRRAQEGLGIETILGRAESLPFEPGTIDFVSMGYALRHVEDLGIAFREFLRVLRPGARACVLEITRPRTAFGRAFLRGYLGTLSGIIGKVSKLAPRTPELWGYYWETIDQCVPPERVLRALSEAGFTDVKRSISLGIFSEYTGMKPA